ncbi:type II toxin-antitoxin system prevent-host-death family antitoxin [Humibacter sp.]|uniref:type II toxin-antitoxin system prevent-host-death family antitoxin n=1 Tax=Humibacter sp. TaxID=1940291 RepID=UPI003F7E03E5
MTTTVSARAFNHDVSAAKRAADSGPVLITDRGEPAYVLLSIAEYRAMRTPRSLLNTLQTDDDIEFDPVVSRELPRAAEL